MNPKHVKDHQAELNDLSVLMQRDFYLAIIIFILGSVDILCVKYSGAYYVATVHTGHLKKDSSPSQLCCCMPCLTPMHYLW